MRYLRLILLALLFCASLLGQTITSTWTDTSGVVHTITTPVRAPAEQREIRKARDTHKLLLEVMQVLYPPKRDTLWTLEDGGRSWSVVVPYRRAA